MIAIDTNVLLRYLLQDDEKQSQKATALIHSCSSVLVTDVVLCETLWTLKGKKYQLARSDLLAVIDRLFRERNIRFEEGQVIWRAYRDFAEAVPVKIAGGKKKWPDFADILIINKARHMAEAERETFEGAFTFDIAAQQIDGAERP
ncbi:PIN domain-containing protein [Endozoicomonas numazuensis]|uniref:Twitching motility protein PilT n=1 Tax=Endozoicomonas numazuensis TaxID=1137799 RepID=A0A081NCV5_9GAMM|nr:type II toxin-antitoxin system VapC family toxin [Endozoicomonas numazuensis]KEQ16278.1 twitching motility protein PilT [Endozoicomonas numazuensis]